MIKREKKREYSQLLDDERKGGREGERGGVRMIEIDPNRLCV